MRFRASGKRTPANRTGKQYPFIGRVHRGCFEVSDTVDLAELVADKLLLKELFAALEELYPENRRIMELFSIGKSERDIAADIGLSQKAINMRKTKLFAHLRERLKNLR